MKLITLLFWLIYFGEAVVPTKERSIIMINNNSVCHVKRSCLDCLQFPQCFWCSNENKCFSEELMPQIGYCENGTIKHINYGMSFKENAQCSCAGGKLERNCVPPGGAQEEECSGRGKCMCGRCFCDTNLDPEHPSKAVVGEYCEFDNFSCDGPKCNEGPYYINEQNPIDEDILGADPDTVQPSDE